MGASTWRHGICGLALVVSAAGAWAIPVERIPNPRATAGGWVSDGANILRPDTEARLNALITGLQTANGSEVAVVTVPDSQPAASPKELATQLFATWKIGQKGKDNGLLFLISVADRRVEIETGYGLEAILPDGKVGQIIARRITPAFKAGNFDGGVLAGTETLVQILRGQPVDLDAGASDTALEIWIAVAMVGTALLVWFVFWVRYAKIPVGQMVLAPWVGLWGLVVVRGLGQSIKLNPRQSSRVGDWRWRFETVGALRCAACGALLEAVEPAAVEEILKPTEKAAAALGSVRFRGWRCRRCAPQQMHLRGYESLSDRFELCPQCQERTVLKDAPYTIANPTPPGADLQITNLHCVHCDYNEQLRQEVEAIPVALEDSPDHASRSSGGFSDGGGFSGGESGGGGAGGNW